MRLQINLLVNKLILGGPISEANYFDDVSIATSVQTTNVGVDYFIHFTNLHLNILNMGQVGHLHY